MTRTNGFPSEDKMTVFDVIGTFTDEGGPMPESSIIAS